MRQTILRSARRSLVAASAAGLLLAGPAVAQEAVDCEAAAEAEGSALGQPVPEICDEDAEVLDLVLVDDPEGAPTDAESVGALAATGVDSGVLALTAGGIVVLGGSALLATRRRKADADA
jgi:LPXTG-motif cell wall-anchored protein